MKIDPDFHASSFRPTYSFFKIPVCALANTLAVIWSATGIVGPETDGNSKSIDTVRLEKCNVRFVEVIFVMGFKSGASTVERIEGPFIHSIREQALEEIATKVLLNQQPATKVDATNEFCCWVVRVVRCGTCC